MSGAVAFQFFRTPHPGDMSAEEKWYGCIGKQLAVAKLVSWGIASSGRHDYVCRLGYMNMIADEWLAMPYEPNLDEEVAEKCALSAHARKSEACVRIG